MVLYGIIGAGGFGREVAPLARQQIQQFHDSDNDAELVFVVEDKYYKAQDPANGHRVMSLSDFLAADVAHRCYNIAIGNSNVRERIANSIPRDIGTPFSIIADNHISLDRNEIGEGSIFCSFSHITSNAKIGRFFFTATFIHMSPTT